jgi:hypothetical protein
MEMIFSSLIGKTIRILFFDFLGQQKIFSCNFGIQPQYCKVGAIHRLTSSRPMNELKNNNLGNLIQNAFRLGAHIFH